MLFLSYEFKLKPKVYNTALVFMGNTVRESAGATIFEFSPFINLRCSSLQMRN